MTILAAALAGFAAGSTHVVTGPDHLAAVLPLTVGSKWKQAMRVGLSWGLGHGAGVVVLALLGRLLRPWMDAAWIGGRAEVMVGILLVALGVWTLATLRREHAHAHPHRAGGSSAAAFGVLHGMGGTVHLLVVLPTLALGNAAAMMYVGSYLVAAVVLMTALCGLVAVGITRPDHRMMAKVGSGVLALCVGVFWVGASLA